MEPASPLGRRLAAHPRGTVINVFMLDHEPRLVHFVDQLARMNGGRGFSTSGDRLGEFVVSDYLQARRGRR